ncbi:MAG: redoxin domain-containing protein [Bacteroidetes bacterium]|nr:redoxin domain-containing protein [Bacteroidota bacterium]
MLKVGDKAPDFKLFNTDKKEVSNTDFLGKNLVILFYPQAFTGTCTKELCEMRDDISNYQNVGSDVVAISVDSVFTIAKFKEENHYNFEMLSDFNKDTSRAYGSIYEDWILGMKGVSKRSAFVLDKEGIIRYAEVLESAGDVPSFENIKNTLVSLS